MLVIDENMFKLARMQESLLRATDLNREENLANYKKTVAQIDAQAFADILEELKHIDEHNQSLEDEVQYLERIKSCYDQLLELQLSFRRVCELYGGDELKLSDLSQLNIQYIENRINTINGYLINLKNIGVNKDRIQALGEQLVIEEKKRELLGSRLLELEEELRRNFVDAEGRIVVDGELQYSSVISEYKKLGLDFEALLLDVSELDRLLAEVVREREDANEKLNTAQLCYDNAPDASSKQILDEIKKDALKVKYRVTMLKILKLLSDNCDNYDLFKDKREKLLDLIKYRLSCINALGIRVSIDPFARTKVNEQLSTVLSMPDNSKIINRIRKDISQLTSRTEEMVNQNGEYLISLSDTRALLESTVSMNDIDISMVDIEAGEVVSKETPKVVLGNQVVGVRRISDKLNMSIVGQKTAGVIRRVSQMIGGTSNKSIEPVSVMESVVDEPTETFVPKLVIVPKTVAKKAEEKTIGVIETEFAPIVSGPVVEDVPAMKILENVEPEVSNDNVDLSNLFETVVPFIEPEMFSDRTDEEIVSDTNLSPSELKVISSKPVDTLELQYSSEEEMPEAFWTMEDEVEEYADDGNIISFDDQISALLANDDVEHGRSRKRVA